MTTTEPDRTVELAQQQAAGLRALADLIESNPDLGEKMRYCGVDNIHVPVDDKTTMAAFIRAGKRHGATITKNAMGKWFMVNIGWGPVGLDVFAAREEVCERVVVGTETVTETVKDPDLLAQVPDVEITTEREVVEWRCHPILADNDTPTTNTEDN